MSGDNDRIIGSNRYLGDGVYASFDGSQIWLDTRAQEPVNRIALEPGVIAELERYIAELRRVIREMGGEL